MTISNKLTISRIALTFVFMWFLFSKGLTFKVLALLVFALASLTDLLDGFLAKKRNEITEFGTLFPVYQEKNMSD